MEKNIIIYIICLLPAFSLKAQPVLKIQPGTVLTATGGIVVTLQDMDFDNDGIFIQGIGQGTVLFNGTAQNTISGLSSTLFDVLQLSKTGSGKVTLQQGIRISSNLVFSGGILDLNTQTILLAPTASLLGESENSHITGENGGYVQIISTLNAPSVAHPGNLGIGITTPRNLGAVTIRRGHQSQTNAWGMGNTVLRYYDLISSNNTALNAKLRFNYLEAELNGLNENALTLWTSNDNKRWTNLFAIPNIAANYIEQGGINSFSRFTLTEATNSLPLIWGSFTTECLPGQTKITWKTLQEQNTRFFVIRRSTNSSTWTNIDSIPAAGNSQFTRSYTYSDPQGAMFYQICQVDMDGHQTYSPVLISQCALSRGIKVYPSPAQSNCRVSIASERSQSVSMRLYNAHGALLQQRAVTILRGNNVFELSLVNYPKGVYSLVLTWSDGRVNSINVEKN